MPDHPFEATTMEIFPLNRVHVREAVAHFYEGNLKERGSSPETTMGHYQK